MSALVWLNGRLLPVAQATVPITDHGLTVGDGVFETTKVIRGVPFARTRHLARLHASARAIGLPLPPDDYLHAAIDAVCATVAAHDLARLRLTVTGGPGPAGSGRGEGPPTVWAAATPTSPPGAPETTIVVPWRRNEHGALTGVKTTSYAENVVALAAARAAGVGEALLANTAGELCEGTGTNVFCVLDGVPVTPPLSAGCLAGVTRALVLAWCPQIVERPVSLPDLARAEEVFLTSATRDVHAVATVDGRRPGGPAAPVPGPITAAIAAEFAARAAENLDP